MFVLPCPRDRLLDFIPSGTCGAEIGVAQGGFSATILERAKPSKLHLVDAWQHQSVEHLSTDVHNRSQSEQDARHATVLDRFAREIAAGQVVVHRSFSHDAAVLFPDAHFDWIYIDGDHSEQGCTRDLESFLPKVKPDGLIMGHDYTWHSTIPFGVVEAVNAFVLRHRLDFLALSVSEMFPTYVLGRAGSALGAMLTAKAAIHLPAVIQLEGYPQGFAYRRGVSFAGKSRRGYPSFALSKPEVG